MSEQVRRPVERDPLVAATDRGAGGSDDPILARLALWLADVAAEAPRTAHQAPARPTRPPARPARA